jgi:hypothetical protein
VRSMGASFVVVVPTVLSRTPIVKFLCDTRADCDTDGEVSLRLISLKQSNGPH